MNNCNDGKVSKKLLIARLFVVSILFILLFVPFIFCAYQVPAVDEHGIHYLADVYEFRSICDVLFNSSQAYAIILFIFCVVAIVVATVFAIIALVKKDYNRYEKIGLTVIVVAVIMFAVCLFITFPNIPAK